MAPVCTPYFYDVLEIDPCATSEDIEAAYQRLSCLVAGHALAVYAMLDDAEVDDLRAQIEQAYQTLRDPQRRRDYDRRRQAAGEGPGSQAPAGPARPSPRLPQPKSGSEAIFSATGGLEGLSEARVCAGDADRQQSSMMGTASTAAPAATAATAATTAAVDMPRGHDHHPSQQARPIGKTRALRPTLSLDYSPALEVNGELLRRLRKSAGANLDDVSAITKISKRYLLALEANDADNLPAHVYVRGFVTEYARALRLEASTVAKSYMAQYLRQSAQGAK